MFNIKSLPSGGVQDKKWQWETLVHNGFDRAAEIKVKQKFRYKHLFNYDINCIKLT